MKSIAEFMISNHEGAHEQIRVAADELRCTVQYDIGAQRQRALKKWCRECVVTNQERTVGAGVDRKCAQIADLHGRIRRRLHDDEIRTLARTREGF